MKHSTVSVNGKAWRASGLFKLASAQFKLLTYYLGWANGCWESDETVAAACDMGVKTIYRARKALVKSGWITFDPAAARRRTCR